MRKSLEIEKNIMISGPMRGPKINCIGRGQHSTYIQHLTHKVTDIATTILTRPRGQVSENALEQIK